MFRKPAGAVFIMMVLFLVASCGGSSSSSSSNNDTMTLTVEGVPTQYSDDQHTIIAFTSGGTDMVVSLAATNPALNVSIKFDNTALTPGSQSRSALITYVIGGFSYVGTADCTLTALATGMGGLVEGSFPDATLTYAGILSSITVSGSFSATRVN